MKHICCWSGGKDSTASIILAHENNEPLDIIVFVEVMFDKVHGISGENPLHMKFIKEVAKPLFESWGYRVLILHSDLDYLDVFYHRIERPVKHMEHKGMCSGFPLSKRCSVKRDCKLRPMKKFYKSLNEPYVAYVGICADEPVRLSSLYKDANKISLLEKYGYTQGMSREKCEEYGLLSDSYELSRRGGCWFCPNAKDCELALIRREQPRVWQQFLSLEKEPDLAFPKWNVFRDITLKEIDERLAL